VSALEAEAAAAVSACWAAAAVTSPNKIDAIDTIARTDIFPSVNKPGAVVSCSTLWVQASRSSEYAHRHATIASVGVPSTGDPVVSGTKNGSARDIDPARHGENYSLRPPMFVVNYRQGTDAPRQFSQLPVIEEP